MFDYSILKRPMYFFAYDLEKYRDELRGFYFDYEAEMPGPVCKTTTQLINSIRTYESADYQERYLAFGKKYNGRDDGTACEKICGLVRCNIERK